VLVKRHFINYLGYSSTPPESGAAFFVTLADVVCFQGNTNSTPMKTPTAITFLAALVAFVFSSHSLALAVSLTFSASVVSIFLADCVRTIKPLEMRASLTPFPRPARQAHAFELAA
jgi:hypothetical protein